MDGRELLEDVVRVRVSARVFPTEVAGRVARAILQVVPLPEESLDLEGDFVRGEGRGLAPLAKLWRSLRNDRILDTARMLLRARRVGEETSLLVHKQAALYGRIRLCESQEESPLGAIEIRIWVEGGGLEYLIDWMAPRTRDGKIVQEITSADLIRIFCGREDLQDLSTGDP